MVGAVEQLQFITGGRTHLVNPVGVHEDVTCRATAAATAQRQQLVVSGVTNILHKGKPFLGFHGAISAGAIDNDDFRQ